MRVSVITDVLLYEGIVASLVLPFIIHFLKSKSRFGTYLITGSAWFMTWIFRQMTVGIVTQYKKNHNIPIKHYYLNIPFIN